MEVKNMFKKVITIAFYLVFYVLHIQASEATDTGKIKATNIAKKSSNILNFPTPLSVCLEQADHRYSQCLSAGVFTQDSCDAFYQQGVDICYNKYK